MKLIKWICTAFLAIFVISISGTGFADTVRITNGEWPPYLSENLKYYGVASRIVTEAFTLEGIKVEYGFFPWNRALLLAQKGKWDGSAVWAYSEDRNRDFYFSEPVIESKWFFFHLKTTEFSWEKLDDLKKFKIGGTLGYIYNKKLDAAEKEGKIKIFRVPKDEQNFEKLARGRIDVFPVDIDVGYQILNNLFSEEKVKLFTHYPRPVKDTTFSLILSRAVKHNENMLKKFNKGLKQLKANGKVDQFLKESRQGKYLH